MKAVPAAEKKTVPPAEKPRVIVVEDDDVYRQLVSRWLSPDFEVVTLCDGAGLLRDVNALEPDVLLLDMGLPDRSGASLCRQLRADVRHRCLPVVFITALPDDEHFLAHMTSGGDALVSKMSPPDMLRRTLWEVLGQKG